MVVGACTATGQRELGRSEHTVWCQPSMCAEIVAAFLQGRAQRTEGSHATSRLRCRAGASLEAPGRAGAATQSDLGCGQVGVVVAAAVSGAPATVGQDDLRVVVCGRSNTAARAARPKRAGAHQPAATGGAATQRCVDGRLQGLVPDGGSQAGRPFDRTRCGQSLCAGGAARATARRRGGCRDVPVVPRIRTSSRHPSRQRPAVWQLRPAGLDDVEPEMGQTGHRGAVWPAGLSPGQCGARTDPCRPAARGRRTSGSHLLCAATTPELVAQALQPAAPA